MRTPSTSQLRRGQPLGLRSAGKVAAVTVGLNLLVWLIGWVSNADFRVTMSGQTITVTPAYVLLTTLIPLALGWLAAVLARRWGSTALRTLAIAGAILGVASAGTPIQAEAGTSTAVTLVTMHVLTGVIWLIALWRAAAAIRAEPR